MKRTALILAGAVAFDLGVMVVAAEAQQQTQTPPVRIPTTSTGPTFPRPDRGAAMGQTPAGTHPGDCVLRPGQPVPDGPCGPAAIADQAAAGNLTSFLPTAQSGGEASSGGTRYHKETPVEYLKIDRVNTLRACTARGGEVVPHQGAQHCRIPPPAAPRVGNPAQPRPGTVPPRN